MLWPKTQKRSFLGVNQDIGKSKNNCHNFWSVLVDWMMSLSRERHCGIASPPKTHRDDKIGAYLRSGRVLGRFHKYTRSKWARSKWASTHVGIRPDDAGSSGTNRWEQQIVRTPKHRSDTVKRVFKKTKTAATWFQEHNEGILY